MSRPADHEFGSSNGAGPINSTAAAASSAAPPSAPTASAPSSSDRRSRGLDMDPSDDHHVAAVMLQLGGSGASPAAPPGADPLQLLEREAGRGGGREADADNSTGNPRRRCSAASAGSRTTTTSVGEADAAGGVGGAAAAATAAAVAPLNSARNGGGAAVSQQHPLSERPSTAPSASTAAAAGSRSLRVNPYDSAHQDHQFQHDPDPDPDPYAVYQRTGPQNPAHTAAAAAAANQHPTAASAAGAMTMAATAGAGGGDQLPYGYAAYSLQQQHQLRLQIQQHQLQQQIQLRQYLYQRREQELQNNLHNSRAAAVRVTSTSAADRSRAEAAATAAAATGLPPSASHHPFAAGAAIDPSSSLAMIDAPPNPRRLPTLEEQIRRAKEEEEERRRLLLEVELGRERQRRLLLLRQQQQTLRADEQNGAGAAQRETAAKPKVVEKERDVVEKGADDAEKNDNVRPSTAPSRIIGLSIETKVQDLGHDCASSIDEGDESLSSPRPVVAAAAVAPVPHLTAPSRLETAEYDSSDDDLTPVLAAAMENGGDISPGSKGKGAGLYSPIGKGTGNGNGVELSDSQRESDSRKSDAHDRGGATKCASSAADAMGTDKGVYSAHLSTFDDDVSALDMSIGNSDIGNDNGRLSPCPKKNSRTLPSWTTDASKSASKSKSRALSLSAPSLDTKNLLETLGNNSLPASGGADLGAITEAAATKSAIEIFAPDEQGLWAIERILGRRYNRAQKRTEYLIVWRGYDMPQENTWEPTENLSVPSLNFVRRRWGNTKPSPSAAIEMTDPVFDAQRVEAYFKWQESQKKAKAPKKVPKKKKKAASGMSEKELEALLEEGHVIPVGGDGMADSRSFVKQTLVELLRKVRSKVDQYGFFSGPVDPVKSQCLDYYDVIDKETEAMDLDTMEQMIVNGTLATVSAFEAHLQRIIHCCRKYNTHPENFVRIEGEKIELLAAPLIDVARRQIAKRLSGSSTGVALKAAEKVQLPPLVAQKPRVKPSALASGISRERQKKRGSVEVESDMDNGADLHDKTSRRHLKRARKDTNVKQVRSPLSDSASLVSSLADESYQQEKAEDDGSSIASSRGKRKTRQRRVGDDYTTPIVAERSSPRRGAKKSSGKGAFGDADDASIVAKRPTRATRKTVDYSESSSGKKGNVGDDSSCISETSGMSTSVTSRGSKSSRRKLDRNKYRDPAIEGSEVPPCRKDISTSIINKCTQQKEWLAIVPEMMNVCNEAARRATLDLNPTADRYEKPLSDVYMRERLEYDTVIAGYTVRTAVSPHYLQGFVVITDFQVWRKTFRWVTSDEPAAGITPTNTRLRVTDADGSLTSRLQNVRTRGGDTRDGIVFDRVAELALLGGLRCGGRLVRTILNELHQSKRYDYVVLQATKIAIPFYERMGFRRVGAVTRFRDNPNFPEVPYRHWSEIVGNEAMEASYMMALSLEDYATNAVSTDTGGRNKVSPPITLEGRRAEAALSLRHAYALLSGAVILRSTGSKTFVHTLRELLATANDFAKCAGDEEMMTTIKRATDECSTTKIGNSKKILRDELDIPADNGTDKTRSSATSSSSFSESDSLSVSVAVDSNVSSASLCNSNSNGPSDEDGIFCEDDCRDVKLLVKVGDEYISDGEDGESNDLVASVSEFSNVLPRDVGVSIRLNHMEFEPKGHDEGDCLVASLHLPRIRRNVDDLNTATAIALQSIRDTLRDGSFLEGSTPSHCSSVMPGEVIVIRVIARDDNYMWLPAKVKRHCREHELPDNEDGATVHNSFIIRTVEEDRVEEFSRTLDPARRGIGREWCTNMDWYSFQAIPSTVLDALLVGSFIEYPGENGKRQAGFVGDRIGSGLNGTIPRWKLTTYDNQGREETVEYTAAALKEAVQISDKNMKNAAHALKSLPPMAFDQGGEHRALSQMQQRRGRSGSLSQVDPQVLDNWVNGRLARCKISIPLEESGKRSKKGEGGNTRSSKKRKLT